MNENEVIEESAEVVDEAEEITEEEIEDTAEESDEDFDFEYDDEGNIIVPEDEYDEGEEDNSSEDEDAESEEEETAEEETSTEQEVETPEGETPEEPSSAKEEEDERDKEIARLRKELSDYKSDTQAAVKKLGGKSDNPLDDLERMAAETEGKSLQEYRDKRASERRVAEAQALIEEQQFERIAAADLAELHAAYPETRQYKHVRELPDEVRRKFCRARNAGFSAKEAYAAANPDGIRTTVATAVKKQAQHDSKAHLKSSVPKSSKDTGVKMTRSELLEYREYFPELSDKEINDLYKKANR